MSGEHLCIDVDCEVCHPTQPLIHGAIDPTIPRVPSTSEGEGA